MTPASVRAMPYPDFLLLARNLPDIQRREALMTAVAFHSPEKLTPPKPVVPDIPPDEMTAEEQGRRIDMLKAMLGG